MTLKKLYLIIFLLLASLIGFAQSRNVSSSTKKIVYTRDGGKCRCCGSTKNLEYDHIIPYSCGGGNEVSNIQLLCMSCNRSKSNSCVCKIHNKTVGKNCCDEKSTKKAKAAAVQCIGTTKKGIRCKNRTTNSNRRCHHHQ